MRTKKTPILYYNRSDEDIEVIGELSKAGINCELFGPISDYDTPKLIFGDDEYIGKSSIELFISKVSKPLNEE